MKGKLAPERYMAVPNTEKLSKPLLMLVNILELFMAFWETLNRRNEKCGRCYNNFALWN